MSDDIFKNGNGWTLYQKLVLADLERHSKDLKAINEELKEHMRKVEVEIAMLKVKSGIWGLAGGMIPVAVVLVLEFLKKR